MLPWQNIWNSRHVTANITFPYQTNGNYATELSTVGHVFSGRHWISTFDFDEIVNNCGLKRRTVRQIIRFISHFSLKLCSQYGKYFHSMVLGRVGRNYIKKYGVRNFGQHFWLGCFSAFKYSYAIRVLLPLTNPQALFLNRH